MATTDTWNGATGAWEVAANWSNGVPTSTSDVVITAGKPSITITTPAVTVNTINNAANLTVTDALPINVAGDVTLTGSLHIDDRNNDGGSTMTIGGTLNVTATGVAGTAAGSVNMGSNKELPAGTTITAAALNDVNPTGGTPGTLNIVGNATGAGLSEIDITSPVNFGGGAGVLIGLVNLAGDSLLEFATGQVTSIAAASSLILTGATAFVADATNTGSNSALTSLASISGTFQLLGTPLTLPGAITNTGFLDIDDSAADGGPGGSNLIITNTLSNSGLLDIGVSNLLLATAVTLNSLDNSATGTVNVTGNIIPPVAAALLTINGVAINAGTVTVNTGGEIDVVGNPYAQTGGTTTVSGTLAAANPVISAGLLTEAVGGVINGDVLILAAGTGHGLVVNNGTVDTSFGLTSGTTINSGGTALVQSGGNDLATVVSSGGLQIVYGVASGATVSSGGEQYIGSGGTSVAVQVEGGGAEVVFGTDSGANLSGTAAATGTQYDFSIALGGTTFSNGFQEVALAGAVASGMTVEFGGEQYVGSGGTTLAAQLASGGAEVVFGFDSGASLSGTQYDFGVASGGTTFNNGFQLVAPGATAIGMTVSSGGQQYIGSGGTAIGTNVAPQGAEVVFGSALGGTVSGTQYDFAYASGGTTFTSGSQQVESGGTAIGMTVSSGGLQNVGSGGTASASVIAAFGAESVHGTDLGATISGTQYVEGLASGTVVATGGYQQVSAGGTISAATISGGAIELMSGASVGAAPITFAAVGELILDASSLFSGTVANFGTASINDSIDLVDIPFVSAGSAGATTVNWSQVNAASGTLTVSGGGHSANVTLLGQYSQQSFTSASDGRGGTLVTDPPIPPTDLSPMAVLTTTRHV